MLSSLFGLGGQPDEEQEVAEQHGEEGQQLEEAEAQPNDEGSEHNAEPSSSAAPFGVNLWGLANAVSNVVKSRTDELVKSVKQTDWRAELMAFSKEAAVEGQTLSHRAAEAVEHIPDVVEHLPGQAEKVVTARLAHVPEVGSTINNVGGSLKTFGQSLLVGTKELIDQIRDGVESEIAVATRETKRAGRTKSSTGGSSGKLAAMAGSAKYNRFEAEVAAMQRDSSTYCDEPDDTDEFAAWRDSFSLTAAQPDIERLLAANSFMAELHARIVPAIVEPHDFWLRYFYRLHKLQAKEETRLAIAQRAKALHEEEELGWDDDDTAAAGNADSTTATTAADAGNSSVTGDADAAAVDTPPSAAAGAQQDKAASEQGASQLASSASHQAGDAAAAVSATVAGAVAAVVASASQAAGDSVAPTAHGDDDASLVSPPETHSEVDHDSPTVGSTSDGSSRGDWCVVAPKTATTSAAAQQPAATASAAATSPTSNSAAKPVPPPAQPQQALSYAAAAAAAPAVAATAQQQSKGEEVAAGAAGSKDGEAAEGAAAAAGTTKDNAHDGDAEDVNSEDEAWGDWD